MGHRWSKAGRWGKGAAVCAAAAWITLLCPGHGPVGGFPRAMAAGSSVIEKLTVTFTADYGEPEEIPEPEVTVSGSGVSLGEIRYRTDYGSWKPGKKVRVYVTVNAPEGKLFPERLNRSQCGVKGAAFVSARALDDTSFQVQADYVPITVLGTTEKAGWSGTAKKRAVWRKVDYAPGYSVVLYGDDKVVHRVKTETNSVDFSDFMDDMDKTYYYEVKAIPVTAEQKKYLKEGEFVTSTDQEFDWQDFEEEAASGGPQSAGDGGAVKGSSYVTPDGAVARDSWRKLSGKWYYFDGAGNMVHGWLATGGKWYYMGQDGAMQSGWVNPSGDSWFLLAPGGEMLTGWQQTDPSSWYYFDQDGYMQRHWIHVDGKWYYMGQDGIMKRGWVDWNGVWYYLSSDGSMAVDTVVDGWSVRDDGTAYLR